MWGLCLYGVGALVAWPCILHRSFGGFCAAIFIIGNGLGSLETAANPYITGESPIQQNNMSLLFLRQSAAPLVTPKCELISPKLSTALEQLSLQFWPHMSSLQKLRMIRNL